jgi:hypothetical protein
MHAGFQQAGAGFTAAIAITACGSSRPCTIATCPGDETTLNEIVQAG